MKGIKSFFDSKFIEELFCQIKGYEYPLPDDEHSFLAYGSFKCKYKNISIMSSLVNYTIRAKVRPYNSVTVYKGTFISIITPLNIEGMIEIYSNSSQSSYDLENEEFMNNYRVVGSNFYSISFVLSPVIMENFNNLKKKINTNFTIKIFSNKMYIFFEDYDIKESNPLFIEQIIDCFEFNAPSIKKTNQFSKNKKSRSNHKLDEEDKLIKKNNQVYVYDKKNYHHIFFGDLKNSWIEGRLIVIFIAAFLFILFNSRDITERGYINVIKDKVILLFLSSGRELNHLNELLDYSFKNLISIFCLIIIFTSIIGIFIKIRK